MVERFVSPFPILPHADNPISTKLLLGFVLSPRRFSANFYRGHTSGQRLPVAATRCFKSNRFSQNSQSIGPTATFHMSPDNRSVG